MGPYRFDASLQSIHRKGVNDIDVVSSSVGLSKDAMSALATSQKELYAFCSLHNIVFCMLVKGQKFEHTKAPAASDNFVIAGLQYNIRPDRDEKIPQRRISFRCLGSHV